MSARTLTVNEILGAMFLSRSALWANLDPKGRDLDKECGYPSTVTIDQLRHLYEREGPATRTVQVLPEETWSVYPLLYESEDEVQTPFEKAWNDLQKTHNIWSYLHRVDELSGIGTFGILLLGINDGKTLDQPVAGLNDRGEKVGNVKYDLLYLRAFDQYLVKIDEFESDPSNPRFGQPKMYSIQFSDPKNGLESSSTTATVVDTTLRKVHWTRVIHVADNRKSSEVFGVPRMLPVLNRLYDLRKVLGGSSEMLWKGGFPGYSFETTPEVNASDMDIDKDALKKQIEAYQNGLQRYLALEGVVAKSLAPQVADPSNHIEQNLRIIAMTLGVPLRIFLGSEAGHLASTQDSTTWNRRLARRQNIYVTPMIIRPVIQRFMAFGILPTVENFSVSWRDLNALTEKDLADVALKKSQALLAYVTSGAESIIPPLEFFTNVLEIPLDQAQAIIKAAKANADSQMTTVNPQPNNTAMQPKQPANPGSAAAA